MPNVVGCDKEEWSYSGHLTLDAGPFFITSQQPAILANRFSYLMNLKGPSFMVDTACSSSLVGTHFSKLQLRNQDSDPVPAMIINGVNVFISPKPFQFLSGANMMSRKGRCFTFDASADGYCRGELDGAICLKAKEYDPQQVIAIVA